MNNFKLILFVALVLFFTSCVTTAKFPVSSVTPTADIVAKIKNDKNGNSIIEIKAKNLAAADRLTPPKDAYIVWINTDSEGVRNIGRLINNNAKTTVLKTLTPFQFGEIFITAEDSDDISYPSGVEISRVKLTK